MDKGYQRKIAKYNFVQERLSEIHWLYEQQVSSRQMSQDGIKSEDTMQQTASSLHQSDLAEVIVIPRESSLEEDNMVPAECPKPPARKQNTVPRSTHPHSSERWSPITSTRSQLESLQTVKQFFNKVTPIADDGRPSVDDYDVHLLTSSPLAMNRNLNPPRKPSE